VIQLSLDAVSAPKVYAQMQCHPATLFSDLHQRRAGFCAADL